MAYRFEHVHIKSRHPRKTAKWWADMFHAKILPEFQMSKGAFFCPIEIAGVKINIATPRQHELEFIEEGYAGSRYGLEHLAILTDDIDADIERLKAQGLRIFEVDETPNLKYAFVETPDNVRVELMQRLD